MSRDEIALELSAGAYNFSYSLVAAEKTEKGEGGAAEKVRLSSTLIVEHINTNQNAGRNRSRA